MRIVEINIFNPKVFRKKWIFSKRLKFQLILIQNEFKRITSTEFGLDLHIL
jgi:hypothetical protein